VPSSVYSKRLLAAAALAGEAHAIVPAGKVWVVKSVVASPDIVPAGGAELDVGVASLVQPIQLLIAAGARQMVNWQGMLVLYANETLQAYARTGTWEVACSGYELNAV
jgi:hypothetical protein